MITQSPFVNKFIKYLNKYIKGEIDKNEFSDRIMHLKYFYKQLKDLYKKELQYNEMTQEFINYTKELENNFSLFESAIKDLQIYFEQDFKDDKFLVVIDKLVVSVDNIFSILDKIEKYHINEKFNISKSPYINELYRLLYKIKSNKLTMQVIKNRVNEYLGRYKRTLQDVAYLMKNNQKEYNDISSYYKSSFNHLELIISYFEDILNTDKIEQIEELLYKANLSSNELFKLQEDLKNNYYNNKTSKLKFFVNNLEVT